MPHLRHVTNGAVAQVQRGAPGADGTVTVGEWLPIGVVGGRLWTCRAGGLVVGQGCLGQRPAGKDLERDTQAVSVSGDR